MTRPEQQSNGIRPRRGSAMLELALATPVLLLLLFGTADLGRLYYQAIEVSNAAAAGAAFGSLNTTNAASSTAVAAAAAADAPDISGLSVSAAQVCQNSAGATVACSASGARQYVSVTASSTFNALLNYPLLPSSVQLTKTVMMRVK